MKNSEQNQPEKFPLRAGDAKYIYSEKLDEIALTASDMEVFQNAVQQAKNKLEALRAVRELLPEHFPEIAEIPEAKIKNPGFSGRRQMNSKSQNPSWNCFGLAHKNSPRRRLFFSLRRNDILIFLRMSECYLV